MLEVKNIKKTYHTGDFSQTALDDVSIKFRKSEFVAILGASGSGKTTFLNIVSGLDKYDSGDLIINGKSTKKFKNSEWDSYRNNSVGFIFQSYNLISHISVVQNIEMGMTLSGVSSKERRKKALEVLDRVGLKDHAHKKPNQLSGGQMQRVAIARALANDPDVIMADEPTGALDSVTSLQIMELIKEIAKDKLVIMVTHNDKLANNYADRIVGFEDGKVVSDTDPYVNENENDHYSLKKTAMSLFTALKLSFNNIRTKKGRTILTAFASSIGIIGIALILSLSNGFDIQIDKFERDTLSNMPIMISKQAFQLTEETMSQMGNNSSKSGSYTDKKEVYPFEPIFEQVMHTNVLTTDYVNYIKKLDVNLVSGISYTRATAINVVTKNFKDEYNTSLTDKMISLPGKIVNGKYVYETIEENFDLLAGKIPENKNELLVIIDSTNGLDKSFVEALGLDSSKTGISFDDILDLEFKLILNDSYYEKIGNIYAPKNNYKDLYNNSNEKLKVVGIVRGKEEAKTLTSSDNGVAYSEELTDYIISQNKNSNIVKEQRELNTSLLPYFIIDETNSSDNAMNKDTLLAYLGDEGTPLAINIFPKNFEAKDEIVKYLDEYNKDLKKEDKILYNDMGAFISSMSGNIMTAITAVLIAFSAISLVVSTIMIAIITYISVLERTKEIGILRALGARKKDIRRVFNAETFIIGLASGTLGILIAGLLLFPVNAILYNLTELKNVAVLNPMHALLLITISIILTLLGGFIPANMAAKKDPVVALRTE